MNGVGRVIGTAGHIDHGKTALTRALTGIDTDRLKEEQERGITIELGFAHLDLGDGRIVGVVDVPGHERFVRTMVAGAVGIDLVVLVIASDEGVMPQTLEHLDICQLLGIARGVVALTKSDLVPSDTELRSLALDDVAHALAGSFLEGAAVVPCSAKTGEGLDALKLAIAAALDDAPRRDAEALPRMPIDRVFTMKGFGTVLTGTLWAGHIKIGDEVVVLPGRSPGAMPLAKVRGIQVHGAPVSEAIAGQRTAINVGIDKELVRRGDTLVLSGTLVTSQVVDARVRLLGSCGKPLKRRSRLLFHSGTTQVLATVSLLDCMKLEPGQDALAQIELEEPIVVLPNDRFILRGFAMQRHHGTTVGGGVVVRTLGARAARPSPAWLEILSQTERASEGERVALEIDRAATHGIDRAALVIRLPFAPSTIDKQLARLLSEGRVTKFDRERAAFIGKDALALLKSHMLEALRQFHAEHPLADGMPREELRAKITPDPKLLHAITESLSSDGSVSVERDVIRLANAQPRGATTAVSALALELEQRLLAASLEPPRPAELALTLKKSAQEIASALGVLARRDTIVRVKEFFFHRAALAALKERLVTHLRAHENISPSEWKDLVGTSRKYSIPLAEHFDAERVTLRVGDQRRLRTT